MSKINAVRFINLNYNNSAIRISDETLFMNGESTLLSLRNGGGKSVLVQMMTAPFVHKRYRDVKDRPFSSYFTTNKPSFILVEWALEQGAGYVLTGMMIRKNQDVEDVSGEALEMINFISEYRQPCIHDIHHLPVVEKGKKEMILKNFSACRQLFESYKQERSIVFFYYDMNNSAQSRQYFEKLEEYQIYYKEWENIIKKVNLKESGLSDLFADCRDEKGLVEKWFLDTVESKLNRGKNRMQEFQSILEKYVGQYKDNQSKMKRRDAIEKFKEESVKIQEIGEEYEEAAKGERKQENLIIHFIQELERLLKETEEEDSQVRREIEELESSIARLIYEQLSGEIYGLEDQKYFHMSNKEMILMEQEDLEREEEKIQRKLYLLVCAKLQEAVDQDQKDLEVVQQRLVAARQSEEELEPERCELGGILKRHYENKVLENQTTQRENQTCIEQKREENTAEKEKLYRIEEDIQQAIRQVTIRETKSNNYDRLEQIYNERYQTSLRRNILGEYEPGTLEILEEEFQREWEQKNRERTEKKKTFEKNKERLREQERCLEDIKTEEIHKKEELFQQEKRREHYQKELEIRKNILRYLNLEEKELFSEEKIFDAFNRKLKELDGVRKNLEKEEYELEQEYTRLTQGRVLELPKEFETLLQELGIYAVYGMEWLKRNSMSLKEKERLVRRHPFLPYGLLLSRQELNKLAEYGKEIYTSFPIPLLVREELEKVQQDRENGIVQMERIRFYVLFNENLLDEEKLEVLVQEKETQLRKVREGIQIRKQEYREYFERQESIRHQEVNQEVFQKNQEEIQELQEQLKQLGNRIQEETRRQREWKEEMQSLEEGIRKDEEKVREFQRRQEDLTQLSRDYIEYENNLREREQWERKRKRLQEQKKISESLYEKQQEKIRELEWKRDQLLREQDDFQRELQKYSSYESGRSVLEEQEIQRIESRYRAITSAMSSKIQDLEEQEQKAAGRWRHSREELDRQSEKYQLFNEEWKEIIYDRRAETQQEILLEDRKQKIERKKWEWNEENTKEAVLVEKIKERMGRMKKECGQENPMERSKIQSEDFEARKNQLTYQKKEKEKQSAKLQKRMQIYNENLTALSEYQDFKIQEPVQWEEDFSGMDGKQLRNFKGILVRDYNQTIKEKQERREKLSRVLNQITRMEIFKEDFYKKPLEAMLELVGDASRVLSQLHTTLQAYESLMEKLKTDISLVEKERERIVELLEDYVHQAHQEMGKIDQNSTITVRERPVKMLKIQTPSWEENENLYHLRLQDFIDEVTKKGLQIFEKNENAREYLGTRMTTKHLYDTVIGIGNIQIRLFKIEEQREYPITWAEVARNSGGEGFLSAFVILSSLLCYMRKDETDIFAEKNEGKVLLMDNPFAQTNASHLLKPLMDMAKKTNTQLICLTGLGGESIYNRFDNIYVLNLIAASLRNGMQYLKADHKRGDEPEIMTASRVQVVEQMELLF